MKTKVASRSRTGGNHNATATASGKTSKARNRHRDFFAATGRKFSSRRESSTSVESQVIALKKTSFPGNNHKIGLFSHSKARKSMKSRSASAGLVESEDINNFFYQKWKIHFSPFTTRNDYYLR